MGEQPKDRVNENLLFSSSGPPTTCKEVQAISGLQSDGEHTLLVQGKELQVGNFSEHLYFCRHDENVFEK